MILQRSTLPFIVSTLTASWPVDRGVNLKLLFTDNDST